MSRSGESPPQDIQERLIQAILKRKMQIGENEQVVDKRQGGEHEDQIYRARANEGHAADFKIRAPSHTGSINMDPGVLNQESYQPLDSFWQENTIDNHNEYAVGGDESVVIRSDSLMARLRKGDGNDEASVDMYDSILQSAPGSMHLRSGLSRGNSIAGAAKKPDQEPGRARVKKLFQMDHLLSPSSRVSLKDLSQELSLRLTSTGPDKDLSSAKAAELQAEQQSKAVSEFQIGQLDAQDPGKKGTGKEISFILKNGQGSFADSFLQEAKLLEAERSLALQPRKSMEGEDPDLLNDDPINALFKEIEEEEFDFEITDEEPSRGDTSQSLEETIRQSLTKFELQALLQAQKGKEQGPSQGGRFFIETICENEDENSEEEQPESQPESQSLQQTEEERTESREDGDQEEPKRRQTRRGSSDEESVIQEEDQTPPGSHNEPGSGKNSDDEDDIQAHRQQLEQETAALKEKLLKDDEEVLSDYDSGKFLVSEEGGSLDSVDRLWQQALQDDKSIDRSSGKGENDGEEDEQEAAALMDSQQQVDGDNLEPKEISEEEKGRLEAMKMQDEINHKQLMQGLVTFTFPSSDESNQANVNLRHYEKYFKHQMHLAPSTDVRMAFMTVQAGFGETDRLTGLDKGTEHYQELGCIGFYGIQNNSENLISILLLTNCSDAREANSLRRSKSAFNNIQQYLVPDIQVSRLKRALKKIIQHLIKTSKATATSSTKPSGQQNAAQQRQAFLQKSGPPTKLQKVQNKEMASKLSTTLNKTDTSDPESVRLGDFLLQHADVGIMLLLGKLYFHLCKFKQSLFSLQLAVKKCKLGKQVNARSLSECLLWTIFVQKIYLVNKLRVLKSYAISKKEQKDQRERKKKEQRGVAAVQFLAYAEPVLLGSGSGRLFDKTEIVLSQEIQDLYLELNSDISEFLSIGGGELKNQEVVLYIKLKLEILRQSPLYRKVLRMQAGVEGGQVQDSALSSLASSRRESEIGGRKTEQASRIKPGFGFKKHIVQGSGLEQSQANTPGLRGTEKGLSTFQKLRQTLKQSSFLSPGGARPSGALLGSLVESTSEVQPRLRKGSGSQEANQKSGPEPAEAAGTAKNLTLDQRLQYLRDFESEQDLETFESLELRLTDIVKRICMLSSYIGCVAQSEVHFWKMKKDMIQDSEEPFAFEVYTEDGLETGKEETLVEDREQMHLGLQMLEEACHDNPKRLLANIKLWQFHRTMATFPGQEEESQDCAMEVAEKLSFLFDTENNEAGDRFSRVNTNSARKKKVVNLIDNEESRLLVTLVNVRSLFDFRMYKDCFELLQYEFLKNSKYNGLLYLYGKYVIKANSKEGDNSQADGKKAKEEQKYEQISYLGSGIGAMEECLKSSLPEFHSRANYYIGLAFNEKNCRLQMPLQSVHFWHQASILHFQAPYQGHAKSKKVKKFLDNYQFFHQIIEIINQSLLSHDGPNKAAVDASTHQLMAKSYISVLGTFEEKIDGPSSLLLKCLIHAHALKDDNSARKCFRELIKKFPEFIKGYIEYWQHLSISFKAQKAMASQLFSQAKRSKVESEVKKIMSRAFKAKEEADNLRRELKQTIRLALTQSNLCVHTTTSEWVRVRILAAKTYIIDKKFNKAVHVLTDLCYVIPPDMLQINHDQANIALYDYGDNSEKIQRGGISFCHSILQDELRCDETDLDQFEEEEAKAQDQEPEGRDNLRDSVFANDFKNRIFIDQQQENEMLKDFQESVRDDQSEIQQDAEEFAFPPGFDDPRIISQQKARESTASSKWDMTKFDAAPQERNIRLTETRKNPNHSDIFGPENELYVEERSERPMLLMLDQDQILYNESMGFSEFKTPRNIETTPQKKNESGFNPFSYQSNSGAKRLTNLQQSAGGPGRRALPPLRSTAKPGPEPNPLRHSATVGRKKGLRAQIQEKLDLNKNYRQSYHKQESFASNSSRASMVSRKCSMAVGSSGFQPSRQQKIREGVAKGLLFTANRGGTSRAEDQDNLLISNFLDDQSPNLPERKQEAPPSRSMARFSVFNAEDFNDMARNPLGAPGMQLRDSGARAEDPTISFRNDCDGDVTGVQTSVFAVNSDVSFLYMIGKICYQSGHNLKLGLQALNDYYLFIWHYSETQQHLQEQEGEKGKVKARNPLNSTFEQITPVMRIRECAKALLCIGQIYKKLNEPLLAQKYFLKILEDREGLNKHFGCSKQVMLAEEAYGAIFNSMIDVSISVEKKLNPNNPEQKQELIAQKEDWQSLNIRVESKHFS